jgi:ParB family chromosome partitioning protein
VKRKALGRGLSALIPDDLERRAATGATGEYFLCPIEKIKPNRKQPRQYFDSEKLEELVASIRQQGVVQPLVVRQGKGGTYVLVVGERRWRAAQKAGLKDVPVVIRDVGEREAFELALVENLHRADLNPVEEAQAYERLLQEHGYTQEQLAGRIGRDRSTITNTIRLLKLPERTQDALRAGSLSPGHARALLALEKASAIDKAMRHVVSRELSVRQTEALVRALRRPAPAKPAAASANVRNLQDRLTHALKTRVRLVPTRKDKGRIEISYASLDELDRLLEVLLK